MKLGEMISFGREISGYSLRDVERKTGISNALISQIETGHIKEPSFRKVVKLAKVLGISLERLAGAE